MRVLAHFAECHRLISLFENPTGDIYKMVSAELLRKPVDKVSEQDRGLAKTACLGLIYGMGNKELAKRYAIQESQASQFTSRFFKAFPAVRRDPYIILSSSSSSSSLSSSPFV